MICCWFSYSANVSLKSIRADNLKSTNVFPQKVRPTIIFLNHLRKQHIYRYVYVPVVIRSKDILKSYSHHRVGRFCKGFAFDANDSAYVKRTCTWTTIDRDVGINKKKLHWRAEVYRLSNCAHLIFVPLAQNRFGWCKRYGTTWLCSAIYCDKIPTPSCLARSTFLRQRLMHV